jgi:hypothetical protein
MIIFKTFHAEANIMLPVAMLTAETLSVALLSSGLLPEVISVCLCLLNNYVNNFLVGKKFTNFHNFTYTFETKTASDVFI